MKAADIQLPERRTRAIASKVGDCLGRLARRCKENPEVQSVRLLDDYVLSVEIMAGAKTFFLLGSTLD